MHTSSTHTAQPRRLHTAAAKACAGAGALACALAGALALAPAAQAATVYALAADGSTLQRFDSAMPGAATNVGLIAGATARLDGLDFRPADGMLYGFSSGSSGIYRVDPTTGATTLVSTSTAAVAAATMGIDFNPVPDRLRVVSNAGNNLRINVDTGAALTDGTLSYAAGDTNAGVTPQIADAAYTNSDKLPATGTQLYYIDWGLNTLVTTSNPHGGGMTTVGLLGVNTDENVGFDIITDASGINTAFASLNVGGVQGFYGINLATGAATLIGTTNTGPLNGLAIAPIPEPAPLTLVLAAFGALALQAQRRRAVR
jgi:hypothetical protein